MSLAEIHGKLSPDKPETITDRSEDLLTSSIFGGFRYVGWQAGLIDWLKDSEAVWGVLYDPWAGRVSQIAYSFWPSFKNKCEPDLALLIEFEEQPTLLLLVEVKYRSGMSNRENSGIVDEDDRTGNQLADQISGLRKMTVPEILEWFQAGTEKRTDNSAPALEVTQIDGLPNRIHLLISADVALPRKTYDIARRFLGDTVPVPSFWLSWTRLANHVKRGIESHDARTAAFCLDTYRLLERRRLTPFNGFRMKALQLANAHGFWNRAYTNWWKQEALRVLADHFWKEELNV